MARVTSDRSRRSHVRFSVPQPVLERTPTGAAVGLDVGVVATLTTSDGQVFHAPGLRSRETQRLCRLPRSLARQEKGSTQRDTTKTAIARRKAKEADRRRDLIEQTTTSLVRDFATPGVKVAATRGLNRAISAQGWSRRRHRLVDTATTCGVTVMAINPAHTSGCCAACGHTCPENRTSHAVFGCRAGGHEANADVNTAKNILAAGLAVIARGGTSQQGPDDARSQPVAV